MRENSGPIFRTLQLALSSSGFYQCCAPTREHLSAPKSRDSLRLRRAGRFLPLPEKSRDFFRPQDSGREKAHKHKLFALVNVHMALGQTVGCPRVNRAKKLCVRLETQEI